MRWQSRRSSPQRDHPGRILTSSASLARSVVSVSITSSSSTRVTCAVCCHHIFSIITRPGRISPRQGLSGHPASTPTCCGQDHRVPRGRRTAPSLRTPRRVSSHHDDTGAQLGVNAGFDLRPTHSMQCRPASAQVALVYWTDAKSSATCFIRDWVQNATEIARERETWLPETRCEPAKWRHLRHENPVFSKTRDQVRSIHRQTVSGE
jgi:hypothetical protein